MERDPLTAKTLTDLLQEWSSTKADTNKLIRALDAALKRFTQIRDKHGPTVTAAYHALSGTGPAHNASYRNDMTVALINEVEALEDRIDDSRRAVPADPELSELRRHISSGLEDVRRIRRQIQDSASMTPYNAHRKLQDAATALKNLVTMEEQIATEVQQLLRNPKK